MPPRRIEIGAVRSASPARREIRVTPLAGGKNRFAGLTRADIRLSDGTELQCRIAGVRDETGGKILTLTPGTTRDTVARMKGATVLAAAEPAVSTAGYEFEELEGLAVLDWTGSRIGTVTSLYASGGNAAIEVTRLDGRSLMLPAIEQVIASVDVEQGEMVLNDFAPYAVEEED